MIGRNTNRRITRAYGVAWVATISRLLKIIDSFAKKPYKRDDILQKRPEILRSLLIVATPYLYAPLYPDGHLYTRVHSLYTQSTIYTLLSIYPI